jgi:hypothetical protein
MLAVPTAFVLFIYLSAGWIVLRGLVALLSLGENAEPDADSSTSQRYGCLALLALVLWPLTAVVLLLTLFVELSVLAVLWSVVLLARFYDWHRRRRLARLPPPPYLPPPPPPSSGRYGGAGFG